MIGKVVQLKSIPLKNTFEIIYGFGNEKENSNVYHFLTHYGNIFFTNYAAERTYIFGGYSVTETHDGFKDIYIYNANMSSLSDSDVEECLLVIIPFADFETTGKKIAGRYPYEGIIEMSAGDKIIVSKDRYSIKKPIWLFAPVMNFS